MQISGTEKGVQKDSHVYGQMNFNTVPRQFKGEQWSSVSGTWANKLNQETLMIWLDLKIFPRNDQVGGRMECSDWLGLALHSFLRQAGFGVGTTCTM